MPKPARLAGISLLLLVACGGADDVVEDEPDVEEVPGPAVDLDRPSPAGEIDADGEEPGFDPLAPIETPAKAVACKKKITVIATVGVPGKSKYRTNGCWDVVVTDGAANEDFRKCSTSSFVVGNAGAESYAYDDTSPAHPLGAERSFLARCAKGASGDGYEFMAYRGGWRRLRAPHMRAYFAELYGSSASDIDSLWFMKSIYKNNPIKDRKHVYPMINNGPPRKAKLEKKLGHDALAICKTVPNGGYFGIYNASWREEWTPTDPRLVALENALDRCTRR